MKRRYAVLLSAVLASLVGTAGGLAQSTAFTYQGRLDDGGLPADGFFDIEFSVWDAESGPSQVGGPVTNLDIAVSNGLFTTIVDFGAGVFTGADLWLELAVRPAGGGAFDILVPRHRVTSAPYAVTAGSVAGPIDGAAIAAGTITDTQLAPGAAAANLGADGQGGVASGGIVLSENEASAELAAAGYVKLGAMETPDAFEVLLYTPPAGRAYHSTVWTGKELLVWGGSYYGSPQNNGARYDPATGRWRPISSVGAPAARMNHASVWTPNGLAVFGGQSNATYYADGGIYNPDTDQWTPIPADPAMEGRIYAAMAYAPDTYEVIVWGGVNSAGTHLNTGGRYYFGSWQAMAVDGNTPSPRKFFAHVWSGTEFIVWGGDALPYTQTGGRYNPNTDSWTPMSLVNAPSARGGPIAVWTGDRMMVWGGNLGGTDANDGALYNPTNDTWTTATTTGAPSGRNSHTIVWTGTDALVWGGFGGSTPLDTGGRYTPSNNTWSAVSTNEAPSMRFAHSAVWSGDRMVVWGGWTFGDYFNTGGSYDPVADEWLPTLVDTFYPSVVWTGTEILYWGGRTRGDFQRGDGFRYNPSNDQFQRIPPDPAATPRSEHLAVWTGSKMILWGGSGDAGILDDGARYDPLTGTWTNIPPDPAAGPRIGPTLTWTGTEAILWGGESNVVFLNTGARYNPGNGTWTTTETIDAPSPRYGHSAEWSGTEMIVWGGYSYSGGTGTFYNGGAAYDPAQNQWRPLAASGLTARAGHRSIWTGSEMIIWGGGFGYYLTGGGRYDPLGNSWTMIPETPWVGKRGSHSMTWAGDQMIVMGGRATGAFDQLPNGGRYKPAATPGWSAVAFPPHIPRVEDHGAFWTGSKLLVVGGSSADSGSRPLVWSYTPAKTLHLYQRP